MDTHQECTLHEQKKYAVVPKTTLWNEPVLKVYFMGEQTEIKYKQASLQSWMVMNIVKERWNFDGTENGKHAPRFEQAFHASGAHIRVKFESEATARAGSWSKLGCQAQTVRSLDDPTMVLNLRDCTDDYHKESTILHEFGHALGLGHEHQHPVYLKVMEKFIDIDATMDCYGIEKPSFYRDQYGELNYELEKTDYDAHSIMHYPTKVEMLKKEYRSLRKPEDVDTDPATKDLSEKERGMLKNFLLHINHVPNKPSKKDISTVVQAYYEKYQKTEEYMEEQKKPTMTEHDPDTEVISSIEKLYAAYKKELKLTYDSIEEAGDSQDAELGIAPNAEFIDLALVHKRDVDKNDPFLKSTLRGGIDDIVASKTPLQINDILSAKSKSRFVLVEGRSGVGKSVFSLELCRQWDTLESLRDYKLVLHLTLRDEYVQKAASMQELLHIYSDNSNLCARMEEELTNSEGEGVLFILDGFDEFPSSIVHDKKSLLMAVVSGKRSKPGRPIAVPFLPKATRLVTSRPSAVNNKCFPKDQRHVEILGFTDDCKERYAEIAFKSEPNLLEHFKKFIRSNPVINALMHIPLNCAIAAQLCRDRFENEEQLPKTMTQLYKALIPALIKRGMVKTGKWGEDTTIPSFTNLFNEVPGLQEVCKLAFDGLIKEDFQLQFTVSAIDNIQCFGLTKKTTTKQRLEKSSVPSFSFLHLSIQEFLAAWYASCNSDLVTSAISGIFTCSHILNVRRVKPNLYNFALFLAGMTGSREFPPSAMEFNSHSFFESQDTTGDLKLVQGNKITLSNPMDMYMFGYALVHAPGVNWDVTVYTSCDALVSCLADYAPDGVTLGSIVRLLGCPDHLSDGIFIALQKLEHLSLWTPRVSPFKNDYLVFQAIGNLSNLSYLGIYFNHEITTRGLQELVRLVSHSSTLSKVLFTFGDKNRFMPRDISRFADPLDLLLTAEKLGLDRLIVAAMSCPTLRELKLSGFPLKLKEIEIPSSSSLTDVYLSTDNHLIFFHTLEVRLFDWIYDMCCVSDIPSNNMFFEIIYDIPPTVLSNAISILNSSFHSFSHSIMSIQFDVDENNFEPCDIKYLSRALRQDPAIPRRTSKRSRSLCDLTTAQYYTSKTIFTDHHHSCPDLLELQSLHMLHDNVRKGLSDSVNRATWLSLDLHHESEVSLSSNDLSWSDQLSSSDNFISDELSGQSL